MRVLLVEDDLMLGKAVKIAIEQENYVVDWVTDGELCEAAISTTEFDIILLDINLPKKSGLDILKSFRAKQNDTPVLILTARNSTTQKVEGLDLGADDYLVKPFDLDELLARMRSLVRRSKNIATPTINYGNLILDPAAHKLTKNDKEIDLSPKEFAILKTLFENIGKVISKPSLEESLYSWDDDIESNAVEVHVHHLRKKLGHALIRTIRGVGYSIEKR